MEKNVLTKKVLIQRGNIPGRTSQHISSQQTEAVKECNIFDDPLSSTRQAVRMKKEDCSERSAYNSHLDCEMSMSNEYDLPN